MTCSAERTADATAPRACFYLVFTAYQLKLALAHQRAYGAGARAVLAHHGNVQLTDDIRRTFAEVLPFNASTGVRSSGNPVAFAMLSAAMQRLIAACDQARPPLLLVASASYPVANWLLVHFAGRADTAVLADGLSAYLPLRTDVVEGLRKLARRCYSRLRHGVAGTSFFSHPHGLDSAYVGAIYAEWPLHMPDHGKPVHSLPPAFAAPTSEALAKPRDTVWFLGQPHTGGLVQNLPRHLESLTQALRADHPQAKRFVYKFHHFEPSLPPSLLARLGLEPELRPGCAEELICESPPLAVYSYRSTALLSLRAVLPPEIPVISVAPWLVQPPGEVLRMDRIEQWLARFGVDRPHPSSELGRLERALAAGSVHEWPDTHPAPGDQV